MNLRVATTLSLCLLMLGTSCSDTARERTKARVDKTKAKVSELKERVSDKKKEIQARLSPLLTLTPEEFDSRYEESLTELRRYDEGLRAVVAYSKVHPELFPKDDPEAMPEARREELRQIWRSTLDYMRALDGIKSFWSDAYLLNPITRPGDHKRAFMVAYLAWLVQYRHGLSVIDLTVPSKTLETLLDEPTQDVPARAFAALKYNILSVQAITRFLGSHQYWRKQRDAFEGADCAAGAPCRWGVDLIASYKTEALAQLDVRGTAEKFSYNAFDIARDFSFKAWFPVQKEVAEWMGDTKVYRLHSYLIDDGLLAQMRKKLEPADIVVSRKNWYLSNIGLPGFWPHASIYMGDPGELSSFFADADLPSTMPELRGHADLAAYLAATYPEAWEAYSSPSLDGASNLMMEAMSEGVLFTPPKVAFAADYIGVMRAKRSKADKARAILRAFQYYGRPYDFNFDFVSDATIVCTELVFKSWQAGPQHAGLDIDLVEIMGRPTLPANELVRQFSLELDKPEAERQLEFVTFLDGLERDRDAQWGDAQTFTASWERPQWDIVQK